MILGLICAGIVLLNFFQSTQAVEKARSHANELGAMNARLASQRNQVQSELSYIILSNKNFFLTHPDADIRNIANSIIAANPIAKVK